MKPVDSSPERRPSAKEAPAESGSRKADPKETGDFEPQYLDVPWQRRRSSGGRNLVVATLLLIVAVAVLGQSFRLVGTRVLLPVGAALLTVVALFVLARARVFRQRNGGFLALSVVCLLAALVPLLDYTWNRGASVQAIEQGSKGAQAQSSQGSGQLPQLTQAYQIPSPGENAPRFKVVRDLRVEIDGKAYLIKAGEIFPVAEASNGEVRFNAGDQQIALPENLVEMLGKNDATPVVVASATGQTNGQQNVPAQADPSKVAADSSAAADVPDPSKPETPSQITQRAQKEVIRRYPALGQKDSPENQLYIDTYQELKHSGADDFFADPQWPLQLAELLAKREGWQRQE